METYAFLEYTAQCELSRQTKQSYGLTQTSLRAHDRVSQNIRVAQNIALGVGLASLVCSGLGDNPAALGTVSAVVRTNGSALNVRSGPGLHYVIVGSITNGHPLTLSGRRSGNWVQLTSGNWVSTRWIQSSGVGDSVGTGPDFLRVATRGSLLNVRSGPGLDYPIIATVANGTVLTPSGRYHHGWAQLASGGWVSTRYAGEYTTRGGVGGPSSGTAQVATRGTPLNVRSGPGLEYRVVGTLANGSTVGLTGESYFGWFKTTSGNWLSGDYIIR